MIFKKCVDFKRKGKSAKQKRKMSGKKKQYPREMLEKAVQEVKAGASLRASAKKYGIPHTTLQDYKKINMPTTLIPSRP